MWVPLLVIADGTGISAGLVVTVTYSPTAECFGVSAHIAFGVLRGTARPCRLVSPVPGTRVPRTGSGNQGSGQGSGNPGFREPGFGARFQEPKVPQTRLSSKVLGTMGSGYLLGSGTSRFREGSGHTWLSTRFREPYHGFEQPEPGLCQSSGITGTPILRHPANPEFGEPGFWQGSSNTGFRQGSENHHRCGPTVWIYFLDYATGSGQGQGQSSGKVPRFRKQPRGRIYAVGCTKVHATDRVPENQFARKPRFQDQKGPVNEQSLTGGGRQRDNKSARLGSGNPGFQYTLWVAPRFRKRDSRKTRFQGHKVPGTQGIPEIPQPILGALWPLTEFRIHVRLLSGRTASVD